MKKIIAFLLGIIGGLLGAWGGASNTDKNWRRLGIPILITLIGLIVIKHWLVLSILSLIGILSMGYGIPDYSDSGSPLGRFYYNLFKGNNFFTNVFTRGTIGLLSCLTLLSIPILISNWFSYILVSCIIISVFSLLSWKSFGGFSFLGKWLTCSEFVTYLVLTGGAMYLIFSCNILNNVIKF